MRQDAKSRAAERSGHPTPVGCVDPPQGGNPQPKEVPFGVSGCPNPGVAPGWLCSGTVPQGDYPQPKEVPFGLSGCPNPGVAPGWLDSGEEMPSLQYGPAFLRVLPKWPCVEH